MRVRELRPWHVHDRLRIPVEASVTHITRDADDLPPGELHSRAEPFADRDPVGQRITVRPEPLRHRLIDDRHAGRAACVLIGEGAAPQDWNPERAEIGRRDRSEPAAAMERAVERTSLDDDRQPEATLERHAACRAGDLHAHDVGRGVDPEPGGAE